MESTITETINTRITRLNNLITGKYTENDKLSLLKRENLLETLQCLYDECCIEQLKNNDKNINEFVVNYKTTIKELQKLRINLNDFDIKHLIGRGQFGEIYIVNEKTTDNIYVMKMIKKLNCLKQQQQQQYINERNIMAFTQSQWLTKLIYSFQDNIYLFFIMDYHPGGNLTNLLLQQGGTIPESAAIFYLAEILLGINDLHQMGYIHCDIKPDNILLDRCGHVKLVDFGSSLRINHDGYVENKTKICCGTPHYIAPEVLQSINHKNSTFGVACDLWSLGCVAYELTVGKPPFIGEQTTEIYAKILNYNKTLKYPSDTLLTQSYIKLINNLLINVEKRLTIQQLFKHNLFKNINFDIINEQIPPYIPKVLNNDDITNFPYELINNKKRSSPNIENFKRKTQFTGRNLPFLNFNFIKNNNDDSSSIDTIFFNRTIINNNNNNNKDVIVTNLRKELDETQKILIKNENFENIKINLEKQLIENKQKLVNIEIVRDQLEKDLANSMAECTALKRTLDIERKDRNELETKALELIKTTKIKWELNEKQKFDKLQIEIQQYKDQINELTKTNELLIKQLDNSNINQQQQQQQQQFDNNNESIKNVEKLQRKSIINLEQHFDKITNNNLKQLNQLQTKLQTQLINNEKLENLLKNSQINEQNLIEKLHKTETNLNNLNDKIDKYETIIIKELNQKINNLEQLINQFNNNNEIDQKKIVDLEKQLINLKQINYDLNQQINTIENEHKQQSNNNKKQLQLFNNKNLELETKLNEQQQQYDKLLNDYQQQQQQQQQNTNNNSNDNNKELRELNMKLWRLEKELNNCKIDKRILERELKQQQLEIQQYKDDINKLNQTIIDNKQLNDKNMIELGDINEKLSLELMQIKENYQLINRKFENNLNNLTNKQKQLDDCNVIINKKDERICDLLKEIDNLKRFSANLQQENTKILEDFNRIKQEKLQLSHDFETTQQQLNNTKLNWEALHEACELLENQLIEYEKIVKSIDLDKLKLQQNYDKLLLDYQQLNTNIIDLKKQINEEKSLKLLFETKLKKCENSLETIFNEKETIDKQLINSKLLIKNLNDELNLINNKLINYELLIKTNERDIKNLKDENLLLKEEISQYLTQIDQFKVNNYKFKQQINEYQIMENTLLQQIEELEITLKTKINYYEEKQLKNDSTIKQQTKLIDYLHSKIDEYSQKKKTLADKLFGNSKKENNQNLNNNNNNQNKYELEIEKLHEINKKLRDELDKLKLEINCNYQHKTTTTTRANSLDRNKIKQKTNNNKTTNLENTHRFEIKSTNFVIKCDNCNKQILLGHDYNNCYKCNMKIHINCCKNLINGQELCNNNNIVIIMQGWLKILKNNKWETNYCYLTNNKQFNIYTNSIENHGRLIETITIIDDKINNKIILEPEFDGSDDGDNELIMKLEIYQNVSLLIMVETIEERDQWYKRFESVLLDRIDDNNDDHHIGETILDLLHDNNLQQQQINCILQLTKNILLIGTDNGIYSYYDNKLLLIDEQLININHLAIMETLTIKLLLILTNNVESNVYYCDLNQLINLIQCSLTNNIKLNLKYQQIDLTNITNNNNNIHYLKVSNVLKHELCCIATKKQLILLKYLNNNFQILRRMDTAQPTNCILFNEDNLIVGSDRFFQIDLNNFHIFEFLQQQNNHQNPIMKLLKKCLPLNIIKINMQPIEYLICFSELMIVVDEYGHYLRQLTINLKHLPLNFYYIKTHLIIHHLYGIDVYRLSTSTQQDNDCLLIDNMEILKNFKIIGDNNNGIYLLLNNRIKYYCINDDLSTTTTTSNNNSDLDTFSFTSSIVQSLDGDIDYVNVDNNQQKHVKFLQTTNL